MNTITCPSCGKTVNLPAKFCDGCGSPINKNLVPCRKCGKMVAKNANRCPNCGTITPNKKTLCLAIILAVVWGILALLVSFATTEESNDTKPDANTPASYQAPELTNEEKAAALLHEASKEFTRGDYMDAIKICAQIETEYPDTETASTINQFLDTQFSEFQHFDSSDLMNEYEANIVNADEKYTDTVMVVTGSVTSIGKTNGDTNLTVMLDTDVMFAGVQLNFKTSQTDAVAKLSEGDVITAIGRCTGKSGTHFVVLSGNNVMIENCYIID